MSIPVKRIASKKHMWKANIQKGILIRLHGDTEGTGLERDFSQMTAWGDAVGDIAGNYIDSMEMFIRRPDRYLPSPQSSLVTRTSPAELDDESREPHRIAMGKMAERVATVHKMIMKLDLPEKEIRFSTVRRAGEDKYFKPYEESILEYPLLDDDGKVVYDVRYHPARNMIAYRFSEDPKSPYYENIQNNYYIDEEDGSKWRMVEPRIRFRGYRIKWADQYWMRANLVRGGYHPSNIFFTHSKAVITNKQQPKNFATDTYSVVQAVKLFGPEGEEGLKLGTRRDAKTGLDIPTAKLDKVMEANTRPENLQRGVRPGVMMPDGSRYNAASAHRSPAYDAQADFAIYNYCMDIAPDIVTAMDLQADEQELRRELSGTDPTKPHYPIFVLPRNTFPHEPVADVVAFLGFDDQWGQLRRILLPRVDIDLRHYRYNNKKLNEMNAEDFVLMMKAQQNDPNKILRFESVRRWPGSLNIADAVAHGAHNKWDMEQIFESYQFLKENPAMLGKMQRAAELLNLETHKRVEPANAMMEEQATRGGFGDLDYLKAESDAVRYTGRGRPMAARGALPAFSEMLFEKARDIYNYHNSIDEILHRLALQPHPIDWCADDDKEAVAGFKDLVIRARRHFHKKNSPYSRIFDYFYDNEDHFVSTDPQRLRAIRWKILKRFLDDDEKERSKKDSLFRQGLFDFRHTKNGRILFANLSRNFRVVDFAGRELDMDYMQEQYNRHPQIVQKKFEKGDWRVQFYRLDSEPSVTATLFQFADMGKLEDVSPVWRARYAALRNLYLNGAPNEDVSQMRWQSLPVIEKAVKEIALNAQIDAPEGLARNFSQFAKGEADVFVRTDEGQRILGEFKEYIAKIKESSKLSDAQRLLMHFDKESGAAYDRIPHEIPAENVVILNVPDPHLRNPLRDIRMVPYSLVVGALSQEQKRRIDAGVPVIFRGEQTGRYYFGGPVNLRQVPQTPTSKHGFDDYLEQARRAYEDDAGVKFPAREDINILLVQKPMPLAHTRPGEINATMQSIKVPRLYFDGLVAPRLAHFGDKKPFTGLVIPVNYSLQKLETGKPLRFREMDAGMGAKLSAEEGVDTGHIYESRQLEKVTRLSVNDLYQRVTSGEINDSQAQACGFGGAQDMWEKVNEAFIAHESPDPGAEEVYLLEFAAVRPESWAYFNPPEAPEAALIFGGQPVPPSAYNWTSAPANDNTQTVALSKRRPKRNPKIA